MLFQSRHLKLRVIALTFLALSSQLTLIDSSVAATIERSVTCAPSRTGGGSVTMQVGDTLIISTSGCLSGGYGGPNNGTWKSGPTGTENTPPAGGNGRLNFSLGDKVTFTATAVGATDSTGITFSTVSGNVDGANNPQILITVTAETTAPTLSSSTPTDNATNVAVTDNIVLTFSEAVSAGAGVIRLRKQPGGTNVETFIVATASNVTGWGTTTLTINPSADLLNSTEYYLLITTDAITDAAGNPFAGISGDSSLNFTTAAALTAPGAPTLNTVTAGDKRLTIAFTAGATGGSAITDYEYSLNGGAYISAGTTTSPFTITGLNGRTSYSVTIKARNSVGLGTASSSVSTTTTDSALDASDAAAAIAEAARVAAAAQAARLAIEQQELINILALIPKLGELTLSLGETTKSLYSTKCVKGKTTKTVKKGAKCPKGFVKR